jgi:hypothetical protein
MILIESKQYVIGIRILNISAFNYKVTGVE